MKSAHPTITTIICTYRRPQMLQRAIDSILNQTYQDFQICVYDNASGDDTAEVVRKNCQIDDRIKYFCQPKNLGALGNYSYAIQQVETPFFSFLADDDIVLPNFYSVALAGFEKEPTAYLSATSVISLSLDGRKVGSTEFQSKILYPPDGVFDFLETRLNPNLHGTLLRREIIPERGGFMTNPWDDRDLLFRIAAAHPIVLSAEECLIFTLHGINKGGGDFTIDHAWLVRETMANSLKPILPKKSYEKLVSIFEEEIKFDLYFLSIELIYKKDLAAAKIGAKNLRSRYKLYGQAFILDFLVGLFTIFPFILDILISMRPELKKPDSNEPEEMLVLSYSTMMDIYRDIKHGQ
jgi:glycosyltransferase involved in cell wall biosynthesis